VKAPTTDVTENNKTVFRIMLTMAGFDNIIFIHNRMFGLRLDALQYGLYWFRTTDQQPLLLLMIDTIINRISHVSKVFHTDDGGDSLKSLLSLLMQKPHLFYRCRDSKFSAILDKFSNSEMEWMRMAIYDQHKMEIDVRLPHDSRTCRKNAIKEDPKLAKVVHDSACNGLVEDTRDKWRADVNSVPNDKRDDVFEMFLLEEEKGSPVKQPNTKEEESTAEIEEEDRAPVKSPNTYIHYRSMIKHIASFILDHVLGDATTRTDAFYLTKVVRQYNPPTTKIYANSIIKNVLHTKHAYECHRQRVTFLLFSEFHNFAVDPETTEFPNPPNQCLFDALMFRHMSLMEKYPRFGRILDQLRDDELVLDGMKGLPVLDEMKYLKGTYGTQQTCVIVKNESGGECK
jgi:hypothetical protein